MTKDVPLGTHAEVVRTVELANTLQGHHADLPPVLSTPNMIGWMEFACYLATESFCEPGEITVGTAIHVSHRLPTGIGSRVVSRAVLEKIEGRFYRFRVTAHEGDRLLGEGTVDRAFVHVERFMGKHKVAG